MNNDREFVDNLIHVVKLNYANPNFDVSSMAAEMKVSDRQLQRRLKALTDRTPIQYLRRFRLEKSLSHLRDGVPVGKAAKTVGFSSHAYFTCCFRVEFGITPGRLQGELGQQGS
jgi:AraC-like DNA-binding protein